MAKTLLPLGIHFGLPEGQYHDDPGLGSTSLKELSRSPTEFQWARLHEERTETEALIRGSMLHVRTLEGAEAFRDKFAVKPEPQPHHLVTMEDLRAYAKKRVMGPIGARKAEAIEAIRTWEKEHGQRRAVIFDEIKERFDRRVEKKQTTVVKQEWLDHTEGAAQWMEQDQLLSPVMQGGTFVGGHPEVSIFYVEEGVRCKARLDYLLPHAIIDLKSFRGPNYGLIEAELLRACLRQIRNYGYDIQGVAYRKAWHKGRELFDAAQVFIHDGPRSLPERDALLGERITFLKHVYSHKAPKWLWVMVKSTGAPQPVVVEWSEERSPMTWGTAAELVQNAILAYRQKVDEFGEDADWPPHHPVQYPADGDWPF